MRRLVLACSLVLLGASALLPACGSSSTVDALIGTWWGPSMDGGSRSVRFNGSGRVEAYAVDGSPTGLNGQIRFIGGQRYEITWSDETISAFLLGPTHNHAALYVPGDTLSAVQRGATNWNPDGYVIEDLAPVYCSGHTWFYANDGKYTAGAGSTNAVAEDASYAGQDAEGRVFGSPAGEVVTVLDGVQGMFRGAYADQFRDTNADMTFLMTPDKLFVVGFANWDPWEFQDGWMATWELTDVAVPADP